MEKKIIIFTAPSGSGKSTMVREFLQDERFELSVSATTREPRDYEVDGKHYHFLSVEDFKGKLENDEFVEHEEVYENQFYGTLKNVLEEIWGRGKIILFDVDVKGADKLKQYFGDDALSIFIKVPSIDVLKERLHLRGTETNNSLYKRIRKFEEEMVYIDKSDYVLVNDDLRTALNESKEVINEWLKK